jgi:arylsulfatase
MGKKRQRSFARLAAPALLFLLLLQTGCSGERPGGAGDVTAKPNIILISLDTLRADRLHCYGYERETSPAIDAFAAEGYLFKDVLSQYPTTPQSHASLLTSRYYATLSASMIREQPFPVMAEILKDAGYVTAGFVDGGYMKKAFGYGFDRGFDLYDDEGPPVEAGKELAWLGISHINEKVFAWLEKERKEPFFLLFHCYDIHCPYTPPEPYFSRYTADYTGRLEVAGKCGSYFNSQNLNDVDYRFLSDLYDGGVAYTDHELGKFFRRLKALDLYRDALIILCSDHGESLGENGYVGHNRLKRHQLRVPLIIKLPGGGSGRTATPVRLLDILPTLIDYLGLTAPPGLEGASLLPLMGGGPPAYQAADLRISERDHYRWIEAEGRWGLWYNLTGREVRLYDLERDPGLEDNVAEENMPVVESIFRRFRETRSFTDGRFMLTAEAAARKPGSVIDGETREQLKKLGYLD